MLPKGLWGIKSDLISQRGEITVAESLTGQVARTKKPILEIDGLKRKGPAFKLMHELKGNTFLGVPIIFRGKVLGVLTLVSLDGLSSYVGILEEAMNVAPFLAALIEQKRTEEALRESLDRFQTVFNETPLGHALVERASGRFVSVNKKLAQILGYSVDELIGRTFQSITHPEDLEATNHKHQLVKGGEAKSEWVRGRCPPQAGDARPIGRCARRRESGVASRGAP